MKISFQFLIAVNNVSLNKKESIKKFNGVSTNGTKFLLINDTF
jgi:hypothetical protein